MITSTRLGALYTGLQYNQIERSCLAETFRAQGVSRNYLARLNEDGSLDLGFSPSLNGFVHAIALQTDGKVLIGGFFTSVNGQPRTHIARLNADGSLDGSFTPDANSQVYAIAVQTDGKILASGDFNFIGGQTRTKIVFMSNRNGDVEIYVMNSNGTNQTRLTNNPAEDNWPAFSTDGTKIVFTSNRNGGNYDIYVMNADGSGVARLTAHAARDEHPSWGGI